MAEHPASILIPMGLIREVCRSPVIPSATAVEKRSARCLSGTICRTPLTLGLKLTPNNSLVLLTIKHRNPPRPKFCAPLRRLMRWFGAVITIRGPSDKVTVRVTTLTFFITMV